MNLQKIRDHIDSIDSSILQLLEKRFLLATMTSKLKDQVVDEERELRIMNKLLKSESSLLSEKFLSDLYHVIFNYSKKLQCMDRVYLGVIGKIGISKEDISHLYQDEVFIIDSLSPSVSVTNLKDNLYAGLLISEKNPLLGTVLNCIHQANLNIVGEIGENETVLFLSHKGQFKNNLKTFGIICLAGIREKIKINIDRLFLDLGILVISKYTINKFVFIKYRLGGYAPDVISNILEQRLPGICILGNYSTLNKLGDKLK